MSNLWRAAFVLALTLLSGCSTIESTWKGLTGASVERTFNAPIARVKPAFISTLSQMGMPIAAMELRGKAEVVKARKADKSVEVEIERLSASSTRVRVTGSDDAIAGQVMRETERRLSAS
ncbi:MAG TPA: hypothetical protein VMT02_00240 [Burkholderiales bacterium]|nr:hypothetical protein [Burkholderiales bacterium]